MGEVAKENKNTKKQDIRAKGRSLKEFIRQTKGNMTSETLLKIKAKALTKDEKQQEILIEFYRLVVNTKYLNDIAYSFYVEGKKYSDIQQESGITYLQNIIQNEAKRLFDDIGDDPYYIIKNKELEPGTEDLYIARLRELQNISGIREFKGIRDMFDFDFKQVSKMDSQFNANVTNDDFEALIDMLKMNVLPYKQMVLKEQLDPEYFGYIEYLLTAPEGNLTREDRERKNYLTAEWMLDE